MLILTQPNIEGARSAFAQCHKVIAKTEKLSPQSAFIAFSKLLFVKLWEDRRLHELLQGRVVGTVLASDAVRFSGAWIDAQQMPNPVDTILFRGLMRKFAGDLFPHGEVLGLEASTVRRVVTQLELLYLFGLDEDLQGRMFETFLAATLRGEALGQYFTPRSITKLVVRLAGVRAGVDTVVDACCGTGGFLIEALTEMHSQNSMDVSESIVGIDAGKSPPIAQIARMNLYLHGGTRSDVHCADSLGHPPEGTFDIALANPPFSLEYSDKDVEEEKVLQNFQLYRDSNRTSLRSSVLFLELYWQLLKPGGRLLIILDDGILGGKKYSYVRDFIRQKFIVRAVVSLHGDAFQRAGARVKTSIVHLVRRQEGEGQPDIFVYESRYVGLDDVVPRTRPSVALTARERASEEIEDIAAAIAQHELGYPTSCYVSAARLGDRLDVKYLRPWTASELSPHWEAAGATVAPLEDLVDSVDEMATILPDEHYNFLKITYEGRAEEGERRLGSEMGSNLRTVHRGDIVVSNINAVNRAICVIPNGRDHLLVSSEFTVLRLKADGPTDPFYLWCVLRSAAVVAEQLSFSSGGGRHRTDWARLQLQQIPLLPFSKQREVGDHYRRILGYEAAIVREVLMATETMSNLGLDGGLARDRLARAKPPK